MDFTVSSGTEARGHHLPSAAQCRKGAPRNGTNCSRPECAGEHKHLRWPASESGTNPAEAVGVNSRCCARGAQCNHSGGQEFGRVHFHYRLPQASKRTRASQCESDSHPTGVAEARSLLSNDVLTEQTLSESESLKAAQVRSVLAVPMVASEPHPGCDLSGYGRSLCKI